MALERDFITPAGMTVTTTANVVGNTAFVTAYSNTARAQTYPVFSQNFAMSPYLDSRFTFYRSSSATYVAASGLIATAANNVPRFEYDPFTLQCKGLLIEEGRINYLLNSSVMGGTNWSSFDGDSGGDNYGIRINAGTAPDGTSNATFFYHTTNVSTYKVLSQTVNSLSGNAHYTRSVFVKANTSPVEPAVFLSHWDSIDNTTTGITYSFNSNGTISGVSGLTGGTANCLITSVGYQYYPDGWVRIYYTFRYITGGTRSVEFKLELDGTALSASTNNVRGVYCWGAQAENGPFITSYIPTIVGSTGIRQTEYAETKDANLASFKNESAMTVVDTSAAIGYSGNTAAEQRYNTVWRIRNGPPLPPGPGVDPRYGAQEMGHYQLYNSSIHSIQHYFGGFNQVETYAGFNVFNATTNTSVIQILSNAPMVTTATVLRSNNFIFVANGGVSSTNVNYFAGNTNNEFRIGGAGGNMYLKRIAVYGGQLSNTEMINITTT